MLKEADKTSRLANSRLEGHPFRSYRDQGAIAVPGSGIEAHLISIIRTGLCCELGGKAPLMRSNHHNYLCSTVTFG